MVQLMARHHVGKGSDGHFIILGAAAPRPRRFVQAAEQGQSCFTYADEFVDDIREPALAKTAVANIVILLKALDRSLVIAGDAQSAVGKDPFRVTYVPDYFFDAPLFWGVTEVTVGFGTRGEERGRFPQLLPQSNKDVIARDHRYVALVVRRVFVGFGPGADG